MNDEQNENPTFKAFADNFSRRLARQGDPELPPEPAPEQTFEGTSTPVIDPALDHVDELLAYAINSVLRAKGAEVQFTTYEAQKVHVIMSHLKELAGY